MQGSTDGVMQQPACSYAQRAAWWSAAWWLSAWLSGTGHTHLDDLWSLLLWCGCDAAAVLASLLLHQRRNFAWSSAFPPLQAGASSYGAENYTWLDTLAWSVVSLPAGWLIARSCLAGACVCVRDRVNSSRLMWTLCNYLTCNTQLLIHRFKQTP